MTRRPGRRRGLWVAVILVLFLVMLYCPPVKAEGEEDRPSFNGYVDVLSQYVWRGYALSQDSAVIQPSMAVSYKGLSVSFWGNFDTESKFQNIPSPGSKWNETDFVISYSRPIYGGLSGTIGGIYYAYGLDSTFKAEVNDLFEAYAGLSYNFPWLTVGVNGYREMTHAPAWTIEFALSRSFKLPWWGMSTDWSLSFYYLDALDSVAYPDPDNPNEAFSGFFSGQGMVTLNIPVWKFITVSPRIGYAFPLGGDASKEITLLSWDRQDWHVFGGVRISAAF